MKLLNYKYPVIGFLVVLFSVILLTKPAGVESIENSFNDLNYSIRGNRDVSSNIYFIYLGDDDLRTLGEWPVTRDYYSYLIHILKTAGAKTIAIDILFAHPDKRHPEYDQTLSGFIQSAGNVCLPMVFSDLKETNNSIISGENPTFPFGNIRKNAAEIGFSNFGENTNNRLIPLRAFYNDSSYFSFGYQMAKNYLASSDPVFYEDQILINHFGELNQLNSMSFINLLHTFQTNPDSLNFNNKLVLFAVTASGIATLKKTPLVESLPASLLHLTVAENLVNRKYLSKISLVNQIILLFLITITLLLISARTSRKDFLLYTFICMLVYWFSGYITFAFLNLVIPQFLPLVLLVIIAGFLYQQKQQQQSLNDANMKQLLQQQIENKEIQLIRLREQLENESISASDAKKLAEQRNQDILRLEKEINDLQVHTTSQKKETVKHSKIICSENSPMLDVLEMITKVSSDNIPVLIMGETGTGKELIARVIHQKSKSINKPFVAVNCGALPENLLESELFGHEQGSFTGAVFQRKGRFEIAADGTIFLDEITETSPSFQIKLLRVLQEGTFERLGGEKTLKTNARVIAASNKNIQDEIGKNKFRSDLFYRLNGFPITLPVLRERTEDIPVLAQHFLKKYGYNMNISVEAMNILKDYSWPGNVRELENIIRRAALIAKSENRDLIREKDLANEIKNSNNDPGRNLFYSLDQQILETLRSFQFSHSAISQTAKVLDNRDRGTITEYFRGLCFKFYVESEFNLNEAARQLAQTDDKDILKKVESKIMTYLDNLQSHLTTKESVFRGLPKKYHTYLEQIIKNLSV